MIELKETIFFIH